jgi:hypothetical protein
MSLTTDKGEREGLETPIERSAKFWCGRPSAMLEYLNLLYRSNLGAYYYVHTMVLS